MMLKYNRKSTDENTWRIFTSVKTFEAYKKEKMLSFYLDIMLLPRVRHFCFFSYFHCQTLIPA